MCVIFIFFIIIFLHVVCQNSRDLCTSMCQFVQISLEENILKQDRQNLKSKANIYWLTQIQKNLGFSELLISPLLVKHPKSFCWPGGIKQGGKAKLAQLSGLHLQVVELPYPTSFTGTDKQI